MHPRPAPSHTLRRALGRALRTAAGALLPAVLLLGPAALAGPAAAEDVVAPAGDGTAVTWGVRTASDDVGADRQNYAFTVDPGGTVTDAIVVTNHGDAPLDLSLYAADGFTSAGGQLDVLPAGEESTGVGAWITLATDHVTVDPGSSLQVDLALSVPEDAEPGDHAGAVVTSLTTPEQADGVDVDRRLGIRVHLRVTGDLAPALSVEDVQVRPGTSLVPFGPAPATVSWTVRNTGNARLAATQAVTLAGPFGAGRVTVADVPAVPELLPGETWDVTVPVDRAWPLLRLGADVTVTPALPAGGDGADAADAATVVTPAVVHGHATAWAVPWTGLLLLLLLAGGTVLARRRQRARARAQEQRFADAVAQAVRERAGADA